MCAQPDVHETFDRLAAEYDELKLRVILGYRHVRFRERCGTLRRRAYPASERASS
jgi:hypothetical protein